MCKFFPRSSFLFHLIVINILLSFSIILHISLSISLSIYISLKISVYYVNSINCLLRLPFSCFETFQSLSLSLPLSHTLSLSLHPSIPLSAYLGSPARKQKTSSCGLMQPSSGSSSLRGRRSRIPNSAKAGRVLSRPPLYNLHTPSILL